MPESMRPGAFSLRDIQPAGTNSIWTTIAEDLGFKDPSFDTSRKSHQDQLRAIQLGIMAGEYSDEDITNFAVKNPSTVPFLQEAIRERDVLRKNMQAENPSLGNVASDVAFLGNPEKAIKFAQLANKQGPEKNITSIQLGLRAEGQVTGDPRIDSLDPKTAANVLARTTPPVAVQTVGGTALFGRGGVPGGTLPQFLPEAPTAEEAVRSARSQVAFKGLERLKDLVDTGAFSPGPVVGNAALLSGATGVGLSKGKAEALSLIEGLSNDLLQAMRGAQVGPAEQIKFEKQLPRAGQPMEMFMANLTRTKENLHELNTIIEQRRRGNSNPRNNAKPPSLKDMSTDDLFKKLLAK